MFYLSVLFQLYQALKLSFYYIVNNIVVFFPIVFLGIYHNLQNLSVFCIGMLWTCHQESIKVREGMCSNMALVLS